MSCPLVDEVVARFLDGDVAPAAIASLEEHTVECAECRRALAQSRHLDAAIAATVDSTLREPDVLVATALAAADPAPTPVVRPGRRTWPLALTAAASFVIGLAVASRRVPPPAPAASEPVVDVVIAPPTGGGELFTIPDLFTISDPASRESVSAWSLEARTLDPARRAELVLASADLPDALEMLERARTLSLGWPANRDSSQEFAVRLAAGRVLVASRSRAATAALARALARGDAVSAALRPILADDRSFRARLRRELHERCEREFALAAAQLADPDLDRALIARCRRDDALADAVAAETKAAGLTADRLDFLLELWSTLSRLGDDGSGSRRDDADRAQAWFASLGPAACEQLVARLHGSRSGEFRGRCILALAAIAHPSAIAPLLTLVDRPNLHEAQLATYALGMLPQAAIPHLRAGLARSRRTTLLWTALASLGDRTATDLVLATGTPFEPGTRLRPEQVSPIAHALRGREPTTLRP